MPELTLIQEIAVWFIPVLFAITVHEAAHGFIAYKLGDTTAKMLGRVSFNPLKHIELFGTIIVPFLTLILSHFSIVFGWAKPVPINPGQLRNPKRDVILVASAGPGVNLMMAIFWTILFKIAIGLNPLTSTFALFLLLAAKAGILVNLLIAFFNLIPLPPLDGSRIVASLLPIKASISYQKIEPFGFYILLFLLLTGVINTIISIPMNVSLSVLSRLFHL